MADNNNTLLYALLGLGGVGLYMYATSQPAIPPGYTHVPPGGAYGGITNGTGASVYVNLAGQVVNALGQIIGAITTGSNGQTTFTGGNNNPDSGQGVWADNGQGSIQWYPTGTTPPVTSTPGGSSSGGSYVDNGDGTISWVPAVTGAKINCLELDNSQSFFQQICGPHRVYGSGF